MKKLAAAAAVLLLTGCATVPMKAPQVNRSAKADKYTAPKAAVKAPMPTPNQIVPKRWFPKYKIKWLHNK